MILFLAIICRSYNSAFIGTDRRGILYCCLGSGVQPFGSRLCFFLISTSLSWKSNRGFIECWVSRSIEEWNCKGTLSPQNTGQTVCFICSTVACLEILALSALSVTWTGRPLGCNACSCLRIICFYPSRRSRELDSLRVNFWRWRNAWSLGSFQISLCNACRNILTLESRLPEN